MSTAQDHAGARSASESRRGAFETRDFYLACFLRCTGYELLDLRAEGSERFSFSEDRPTRREDVIAFYGKPGNVSSTRVSPPPSKT